MLDEAAAASRDRSLSAGRSRRASTVHTFGDSILDSRRSTDAASSRSRLGLLVRNDDRYRRIRRPIDLAAAGPTRCLDHAVTRARRGRLDNASRSACSGIRADRSRPLEPGGPARSASRSLTDLVDRLPSPSIRSPARAIGGQRWPGMRDRQRARDDPRPMEQRSSRMSGRRADRHRCRSISCGTRVAKFLLSAPSPIRRWSVIGNRGSTTIPIASTMCRRSLRRRPGPRTGESSPDQRGPRRLGPSSAAPVVTSIATSLGGRPDWSRRTIEPSLTGASEVRRCFLEVIEARRLRLTRGALGLGSVSIWTALRPPRRGGR